MYSSDEESVRTETKSERQQSFDSGPLWATLSPILRTSGSPAIAQFDEHESAVYEEGEVQERDETPPSNQNASRSAQETCEEETMRLQDVVGEHARTDLTAEPMSTACKRSWMGSPPTEEVLRPARRHKHEHHTVQKKALRLPSIDEMVANPWGGLGNADRDSFRFGMPVSSSTPKPGVEAQYSTPTQYEFARHTNQSGQPPTPFSFGTLSSETGNAHHAKGHKNAGYDRTGTALGFEDAGYATDRSVGADEDMGGLLEERQRRASATRRNLRDVLTDPEPGLEMRQRDEPPHRDPFWRARRGEARFSGGYVSGRGDAEVLDGHGARSLAVDDLEKPTDEDRRSRADSYFSAIPNTKAWDYRATRHASRMRRDERGQERMQDDEGPNDLDAPDYFGCDGRTMDDTREHERDDNVSRMRSASMASARDYDQESYRGRDVPKARQNTQAWDEGSWRAPDVEGEHYGWYGPSEDYGATPTAMEGDEEGDDKPVLLDDPRDSKWAVHFDDPETLLCGQSGDWTRVLWRDPEPSVMFTVFNYRYTKDGPTNRHIEASVTALTELITGESGFHVVPPDPEWKTSIKVRDLPFVWVIRGLSAEGATAMTRLRVISTRAVSIITYPRYISNPRWVCGLVGFLRPDVDAIKAAVLQVLRTDDMLRRLEYLTSTNKQLEGIPKDRRVDYIIGTLRIKISVANDGEHIANVYIFPPTNDLGQWREWAGVMRSSRYNVFLNGTGMARKVFWCAGCRGVDHEAEECPLPTMRGWKGPDAGERSHTLNIIPRGQAGKPVRGRGAVPMRGQPAYGHGKGRGTNGEWTRGAGRGQMNGHWSADRRGGGAWQERTPARWTPRGGGRGMGGASRWS